MAGAFSDPASTCSWCLQLDESLLAAEDEAIPDLGRPILSVGRRERKTDCSVCRFFLIHAAQYKRKYVLHVRLFDRIRQPSLDGPVPRNRRFLAVIRQNERLSYDHATQKEVVQQGIIEYQPRGAFDADGVSLLDPKRVDYASLLSSMMHCKRTHENCCQAVDNAFDLTYINLVDCETLNIVRGDLDVAYLALSYVWGQPKVSEPARAVKQDSSGRLSLDRLPLTIRDAIQVVRNLGMKYLWVDRYCINHDDGQEKKLMISHMDQIYERAEATIVALDGESDEAGLPGVSTPRILQSFIQTSQWQFVSSCPPIGTLISRSIWATRGWTYQEARLSRRCLFFTNHQVYLVCRQSTSSEALHTLSLDDSVSVLLNSSSLDSAFFTPQVSLPGTHCQDRHIYSRKQLSFQNDVLDAFRGILQRSPFISFWGVPVVPFPAQMDANVGFALGLLWCRRPEWSLDRHLVQDISSTMARRGDFPTWSWASVTGEIYNEGYGPQSVFGAYLNGITQEAGLDEANVLFWVMVGGMYTPLSEVISNTGGKMIPEEALSQRILVEGDLIRVYRDGDAGYKIHGVEQLDLTFSVSYDIAPAGFQERCEDGVEDALVLVNWNDCQRKSRRRFIMMLIEWVEDGVAERRGLLSSYRLGYSAEVLGQIPRTRTRFMLQ